jgi:hypothetical protein
MNRRAEGPCHTIRYAVRQENISGLQPSSHNVAKTQPFASLGLGFYGGLLVKVIFVIVVFLYGFWGKVVGISSQNLGFWG